MFEVREMYNERNEDEQHAELWNNEEILKLKKGNRILITLFQPEANNKYIVEVCVLEVSPSGRFLKGETSLGHSRWYDLLTEWVFIEKLKE
jgi:hypothetical protein